MAGAGRRGTTTLLAAMLLAGCGGGLNLGGLGAGPPETVAVAGRSVVIGGAPGYCVDRSASRLGGDNPFVLLGSCASIAGDRRRKSPAQPGILTAAVSAPGGGPDFAATLTGLETFLASAPGRAALARDGNPGSVRVLSTQRDGDALLVHLRDSSANTVPGVGPAYWRGLFEVNGRLVTVSVMAFEDQPLGSDASIQTLRSFIDRIRRESAAA